ncbi:hypothetical protein BKA83DRAFT_4463442 [Pisolithus microcarpus]|nr:hypothetical protein BKA83DRAFT_4463442 [Pisolithus microcarpus]
MCQGIVPCSPIHPTAAVTIGALELFCITQLCSPHFSIQAFIKTLCDLQGHYLSCQFSIAFDLYLQIRGRVDSIVLQVLQQDLEDWQLKHTCAACTYKLTDEPGLKFKLLYAMDGNDSLKHIADNHPLSHDLPTANVSHEYVNKFAMAGSKDPISNICDNNPAQDLDSNPCAGHWKNMDDAKTKKIWGVHDETGTLWRAKYLLAMVSKLMAAFGDGLGGGYNIGCQFQTMLATSTLGPQVQDLNHTCLVGAFHGHVHRCLCQLSHLTLYVEGLGLEDLETCKSINVYFEHNDTFEIYANLTNFLFDNYKQVMTIIHDNKAVLTNLKCDLSIDDDSIFHRWLEEEKKYLEGISHEPLEDMLHMEYWQRLGKLEASSANTRVTRQKETLCQHAQENYNKDLLVVQELECKLNVSRCWVPEDKEWQQVGHLVENWEYCHALDTLESLVVAWLFELTKMNRAGTGYKLWKHIAKALQTHSAAIKAALERYNKCALAMQPPHRMLQWEQVIEYAFLANFDLLQDTHEDISKHPWAHPTVCFALDTYFKMCQAKEEIECLNIKICQVITYMCNKERFLRTCEEKINSVHPTLAHQVSQCRKLHSQFNASHLKHLHDIALLLGFSGTIYPAPIQPPPSQIVHRNTLDSIQDLEEEEEAECEAEEASHALQDVLEVSFDLE